MGAGVRDAFPPPMCCVVVFIHLRMETPLRGRSGGHAGTAPTVSFGQMIREFHHMRFETNGKVAAMAYSRKNDECTCKIKNISLNLQRTLVMCPQR